ncbi:MAG: hypothetical protein NC818_03295 [Candidatus Omnitrophica bacterium]|nr:hypothetical protein [Candidatus Omnitrophota bacterium]
MKYSKLKTIGIVAHLITTVLFCSSITLDTNVNGNFVLITRRVRDLSIESLYTSTLAKIEQTFERILGNKNKVLDELQRDQLNVFKEQLKAFAAQARLLYRDGPARDSKVPSDIANFHQQIAIRVLQELDTLITMLSKGSITFEYEGKTFTSEIEQSPKRINILIGQNGNVYIDSAKEFAINNRIPWERFINYVASNLTHTQGQIAQQRLAQRFSLRIDYVQIRRNGQTYGVAVLDITSPYICIMLALRNQAGRYHNLLFGVKSEYQFLTEAKKFFSLFDIPL